MCTDSFRNKTRSLRVDGEMTIYRASDIKRELFKAIDEASVIELDLSGVSAIDTTGVQLIMLTKIMAEAKGGAMALIQSSACVREVIELLGLSDYFREAMLAPLPQGIVLPCPSSDERMYAA